MNIRIRIYGHLRAAFGLAGGAQATRRLLEHAGCLVEPIDLALASHPPLQAVVEGSEDPEPAPEQAEVGPVQVELVHTNPNILAHTPGLLDPASLTAPIRIAYWAWELEQFPEGWHDHFWPYHEIWCPSAFTAQALAQRAPIPVVAVPHLPDWPRLDALYRRRRRLSVGISSRQPASPLPAHPQRPFRFLTLFDYWSTPERKNPAGVIEAFQRAFPLGATGTPAVELWLKTSSAEQFPRQAEALRALAGADPRIHWLDRLLAPADLDQLLLEADALVSLHRAEGFGLVLAEAMAIGLPVIATGYSGNGEFCLPGSCLLVPWQPIAIPATTGDYPAGAIWAEPELAAAAAAMQQLVADPAAAQALGERGRVAVRERLDPDRLAAIIRQRLGSHLLPSPQASTRAPASAG